MTEIREGERLDEVNDSLRLIQKTNGLMFGTDALLLASYINKSTGKAIELGGGTGIISLLVLARDKARCADVIEVQEEYAELIDRNARLNRLDDRMHARAADLRDLRLGAEYDLCFTNPPYMRVDSGRANVHSGKNAARHEVHGGIRDFCLAAAGALRFGGSFYAVYRTDRLVDLITAMREAAIEPKRMTLVHADIESEPSMVLVEGRRGGRPSLKLTRPLIIHTDPTHEKYTDDMEYIMKNGSFGEDFGIKNG